MTDLTPPPPPPPPPTAVAASEPAAARVGRGGKRLIIGSVAVVAIVALGGGAFAAWQKLDGGGAQPHDVLPSSVVAYARVDVDPSASQKIALLKLIRKFPEAANSIGIKSADQDVRKLLFDEILSEGDCDLTYDKDIKPWIGSRIGVGLDKEQTPLVAIQVTDEAKAKGGIKALFACGSGDKASAAFLDGYAIVAQDQKKADAAVAAATKSSLGDNNAFVDDFDNLGEQGVASGWVDTKALVEQIPELKSALKESSPDNVKALEQAGTIATTLRVDGNTIELAGVGALNDALAKTSPAPLGTLPADTVAAISVGGLGDQVSKQYDTLLKQFTEGFGAVTGAQAMGGSITDGMTAEEKAVFEDYSQDNPIEAPDAKGYIAEFEKETGLKLPGDLETLFGDGLTVAIGSKNLETIPTLESPTDIATLDVALKMTTDPTKALDLAQRLAALASKNGVELSAKQSDDGAVLATNAEAAAAFGAKGKLGESETFKSVMPYGDETSYGFFVDITTILDKVNAANPPESVSSDLEEARPLKAFGVSYGTKGEHSVFSVRLALTK